VSKNSAQLVGPHNQNTLLCMLMQLTEPDCSHHQHTLKISAQ